MSSPTRGNQSKTKNQAMAERMKREGITRKTGRCPICSKVKPLPLDKHIPFCHGGK